MQIKGMTTEERIDMLKTARGQLVKEREDINAKIAKLRASSSNG
jgi:hypothetical protein